MLSTSVIHIVKRLRLLIDQVESRGHKVRMLAGRSSRKILGRSAEVAERLESEAPGKVCWVQDRSNLDSYYVLWPKDGLCDWGSFVAVADAPGLRGIAAMLSRRCVLNSPMSEGGLFLRAGDRLLVSSHFDHWESLPTTLRAFILPHPYASDRFRRHQPERSPLTHLDLDLALVPSASRGMLFAGERYFRAYRGAVEQALERLDLDLTIVPQVEVDRRALNLVVLSDQAVLVPAECPHLRSILKDLLGSECVVEVAIDDVFNYNGGRGGLGCMSSVVQTAATQ